MKKLLRGAQFYEPDFPIYLNRESETFATSMHVHDFVEISFVSEGRGFHYVENETIEVQKGDLFLLPIGISHVFRPSTTDKSNPLVILNFIFDLKALAPLRSWIPEHSELSRYLFEPKQATGADWYSHHDKSGQFQSLFQQAYFEYSERPTGYRTMVTAILLQLLQLIHRTQAETATAEAALSPAKIEEALLFIDRHYSDKITLKDVADRAFMSVGHFQNQFKKATGQTFNHYVQNVRIQKCCHLLQTTDKSVQQTANEVGYSDMKFFHSLFRKITGNSPQQFRRA